MSTAYWDQWDQQEIMSMQGIEFHDEPDLYHDESESDLDQTRCNCANCDDCLGFSWNDFM